MIGRNAATPFAIAAASGPVNEVNAMGSDTDTLDISTTTADPATDRKFRTAAGDGAFGDCEKRCVNSICTKFASRRLWSAKGRCASNHGIPDLRLTGAVFAAAFVVAPALVAEIMSGADDGNS